MEGRWDVHLHALVASTAEPVYQLSSTVIRFFRRSAPRNCASGALHAKAGSIKGEASAPNDQRALLLAQPLLPSPFPFPLSFSPFRSPSFSFPFSRRSLGSLRVPAPTKLALSPPSSTLSSAIPVPVPTSKVVVLVLVLFAMGSLLFLLELTPDFVLVGITGAAAAAVAVAGTWLSRLGGYGAAGASCSSVQCVFFVHTEIRSRRESGGSRGSRSSTAQLDVKAVGSGLFGIHVDILCLRLHLRLRLLDVSLLFDRLLGLGTSGRAGAFAGFRFAHLAWDLLWGERGG